MLPLLGLIPATLVKEDLRRLNARGVANTVAVEDSLIKKEGIDQVMAKHFKNRVVLALNKDIQQLESTY